MCLPKNDAKRKKQRLRKFQDFLLGDMGGGLSIIIQKSSRRMIALLLFLALGFAPASAREVKVEYLGFDLIGELEIFPGKSLKKNGVFLVLHDVMSHLDEGSIAELRSSLLEKGYNVLAINLSLGLDARKGRYDCAVEQDHLFADALPEIHAWVKWLRSKKTSDITLLGMGLGANQMALYASKTTQKPVRSVILLAPRQSSKQLAQLRYQQLHGKALGDVLFEAEAHINASRGGTLLAKTGFLTCPQTRVSARSFVSYYRDNPELGLSRIISTINKPTLVIGGELGEESENLIAGMQGIESRDNLRFDIIEAADDRFLGPFMKQVAERIKVFKDETKGR